MSKSYHSQVNSSASGQTSHGSASFSSASSVRCGQARTTRPRSPAAESTVTDSRCRPLRSGESGGRNAVPLVTQLALSRSSQKPNASGLEGNHAAPRSAVTSCSMANSP